MKHGLLAAAGLACVLTAGHPAWAQQGAVATPGGIYAIVPMRSNYDAQGLERLLANPAVSGIALRVPWRGAEPSRGAVDFSVTDDVVARAKSAGKTVQLILVPGFSAPDWLLSGLVSCDPRPSPGCGKAAFPMPYGGGRGADHDLPLPWDETYHAAWRAFLSAVAARYNHEPTVVSVAITGPTSVSAEMFMPGGYHPNGRRPNARAVAKWNALFGTLGPDYPNTNKAIVEQWRQAIDVFGQTFDGKTLVVTRSSGLFEFSRGMSQRALDEIVAIFVGAQVGHNRKATQTSGLTVCRGSYTQGVKDTVYETRGASSRLLGGTQFDQSIVANGEDMACGPGRAPEAILDAIFKTVFDRTPYGPNHGGARGEQAIQYVQIYQEDIAYAATHPEFQRRLDAARTELLSMRDAGL